MINEHRRAKTREEFAERFHVICDFIKKEFDIPSHVGIVISPQEQETPFDYVIVGDMDLMEAQWAYQAALVQSAMRVLVEMDRQKGASPDAAIAETIAGTMEPSNDDPNDPGAD